MRYFKLLKNLTRKYSIKQLYEFFYWEIIKPIFLIPSRLIFGNFNGLRKNILPRINFFFKSFNYHYDKKSDSYKIAKKFKKEGYLIIKKESQLLVNEICKQYHEAFAKKENQIRIKNGGLIFIKDPLKNIPSIKKILHNKIDSILRNYYKNKYYVHSIGAWRINHIESDNPNKDVGISNALHNDGAGAKTIQIFFLISDNVNRSNGSTKFLNKRDSIRICRNPLYFSRKYLPRKIYNEISNKLNYFEGNSGDILILHTDLCLHGSSIPNKSTYRDIIGLTLKPHKEILETQVMFKIIKNYYNN